MKRKIPELLSPAGSYDAFIAAIHAGCDAVYLGGEKFGARANAQNFTRELLVKAIDYAHLLDKKVYYTANTLIKENEIHSLLEEVAFLYREGIDALIMQDMGAYRIIKRNFPELPLHASTQMTVHSMNGVRFVREMGFDRVVLSRELSLEEIKGIKNNIDIEIECFIHGALCYSYSGQCLMSSMIGGRSGNRGSCAQPCRLPYRLNNMDGYFLSPKDIQTLTILPSLIESGIDSFKIEGRMKNPTYVGLITSLYRKYIDQYYEDADRYKIDEKDMQSMNQIFNRGGFSTGYYFQKNGNDMMCIEKPKHQGIEVGRVTQIGRNNIVVRFTKEISQGDCIEISSEASNYSFVVQENIGLGKHQFDTAINTIKQDDLIYRLTDVKLSKEVDETIIGKDLSLPIKCEFTAKIGEKCRLSLSYLENTITIEGNVVEVAKTSPMSYDQMKLQICKTGNDPVTIKEIQLDVDDNIFMSIKELNSLRREGIKKLLDNMINIAKRSVIFPTYEPLKRENTISRGNINVLVTSFQQFEIIKKYMVDNIYLELTSFTDFEIREIVAQTETLKFNVFIALPRIIRDNNNEYIKSRLSSLQNINIKGFLIRTLDTIDYIEKHYDIILDYTMNVINQSSIDFWLEYGVDRISVSPELNSSELAKLSGPLEIITYGYLPLMITNQCINQMHKGGCNKDKTTQFITDRKDACFFVKNDCDMCLNTIYNSVPIVLLDKYREIKKLGSFNYRIEFTKETTEEIEKIMDINVQAMNGKNIAQTDIRAIISQFTRGHYNRGIQ